MKERDTVKLSKLADELFSAIGPLDCLENMQKKVSDGGWRCLKGQHDINFIEDDRSTGYRRVVSLTGVKTVRVREFLPLDKNEMSPVRRDRYESLLAIFPMYKNNPVFDELVAIGVESSMNDEELIGILSELILLLY